MDDKTGSATEADVIAAVASTIQQMRIAKGEDRRLESAYPHVSVLSADNYFGARFNDDILRVAILRSSQAAELEQWDGGKEEERRARSAVFCTERRTGKFFCSN